MSRKAAFIFAGFLSVAHLAGGADAPTLWATKVQPLLGVNCVKCHGPLQQKGGLELDSLEMLLKGGDDGAAIMPGKPEESRLYKNLQPDADPHMPPKKQLGEADRKAVREWIAAMTPGDVETAIKPKPVRQFASIPQAIDTLITEGWQRRGVKPAASVDDRTWCRRVYLDLAGRICTPEELQA